MNELTQIQKQLEVADEHVTMWERAVSERPDLPSAAANLRSARRMQAKLREQLRVAELGQQSVAIGCVSTHPVDGTAMDSALKRTLLGDL